MELYADEQLDDLQYGGLTIIRKAAGFTYGHDAVLLANFMRAKPGERAVDICCGGGIIALLASAKTKAEFVGVDIQQELIGMANRSAAHNGQTVRFYTGDIRTLPSAALPAFPREGFDAACCNPPYYAGGTLSALEERRLSTHEEACTVEDACACASRLLRFGGRFYLVYPAFLLARACTALSACALQAKRVALVRSAHKSPPKLVLIEAKKGAKPGITYDDDIILEDNT